MRVMTVKTRPYAREPDSDCCRYSYRYHVSSVARAHYPKSVAEHNHSARRRKYFYTCVYSAGKMRIRFRKNTDHILVRLEALQNLNKFDKLSAHAPTINYTDFSNVDFEGALGSVWEAGGWVE